jgi:hypothetical protein
MDRHGGEAAIKQQAADYEKHMETQKLEMRQKLIAQYGSEEALDAALKQLETQMKEKAAQEKGQHAEL